MSNRHSRMSVGGISYLAATGILGAYFTFFAVQGDFGVFRQVQINAEADTLRIERDALMDELASLQNRTLRLSDRYLDLDLLDQQARDVLGYVRADEIALR